MIKKKKNSCPVSQRLLSKEQKQNRIGGNNKHQISREAVSACLPTRVSDANVNVHTTGADARLSPPETRHLPRTLSKRYMNRWERKGSSSRFMKWGIDVPFSK